MHHVEHHHRGVIVCKFSRDKVLLLDPEPLMYHAEVLWRNGVRVGDVRAASYGHTLGGAVGLALVEVIPCVCKFTHNYSLIEIIFLCKPAGVCWGSCEQGLHRARGLGGRSGRKENCCQGVACAHVRPQQQKNKIVMMQVDKIATFWGINTK